MNQFFSFKYSRLFIKVYYKTTQCQRSDQVKHTRDNIKCFAILRVDKSSSVGIIMSK